MNKPILTAIVIMLFLSSCIVQSPKYTTVQQVLTLKIGMTKAEVEDTLGLKPYDIKLYNDTGNTYVYVYRVVDRRTFPFNTKPTNGKEVLGKYIKLAVTYSKDNKVMKVEPCTTCTDNLEITRKLDFQKVTAFITVTLPVILIYLGLKK